MGRMEHYKGDAYHVRRHSRPTPRLAHVIYLFIFDLLVTVRVSQGFFLACLRYLKLFRVCRPLLEYLFCKLKGKDLPAV